MKNIKLLLIASALYIGTSSTAPLCPTRDIVDECTMRVTRPDEIDPMIVGPNFTIDLSNIFRKCSELECCCKELATRVEELTRRIATLENGQ